ncbi:Hsp70 protein that interacts with Zuo1p [Puccinia graminis f. sp. tritici]|uniref:Hsp70 protein that interacts with Zuo1p n=1 Tax=Puccinia graminis f. sp. tritici TaxID=56615 RepID=A0A5B0Q6V4_PUCGR|nr:Hsp70 protein that interacts with Zuo1p [Puccinia graminis f. sp. tritici]
MPPKKNQKKSQQTSKANSKAPSKVNTPQPPGTPLEAVPSKPLGPAVVGINFGQTASSIALINKDGTADCIANDDGERQIPSVISFSGSETYVGNPARLQLIRNQANTIVGFRNLLGKSYDEVKSTQTKTLFNSAPIINKDGQPAYLIKPCAGEEANDGSAEQVLTVTDIATKYLSTLLKYAQDFIGRKPDAAVLSVSEGFGDKQIEALRSIVEDKLDVKVLQFITEAGATAVVADLGNARLGKPSPDGNLLVLDVGGSSTTATVMSRRNGLVISLASSTNHQLGGNHFEDQLMDYFVKEFNKKNKTTLNISDEKNHKSAIKLRLATEVTKKTLSASNSANCSVDSLFDGYDFSGSINRMRCDLLLSKSYAQIMQLVSDTLASSKLQKEEITQAILVGGSTKLPAIKEKLIYALHSNVNVDFSIENDEAVAIGCVLQADLIVKRYPLDSPEFTAAFKPSLASTCLEVKCLSKPLGLLLPAGDSAAADAVDGKRFITLLDALTPLPVKKVFKIPKISPGKASTLPLDLWQGESYIKTDSPQTQNGTAKKENADEEDDDEEEEEPERILVVKPTSAIAHVDIANVQEADQATITIIIDGNQGLFEVSSGKSGVENSIKSTFSI